MTPKFQSVFGNAEYLNFSRGGAGNTYIRYRLFEEVRKQRPDYVYLQFSELVRRDLALELDAYDIFKLQASQVSYEITDEKIYVFGGNMLHEARKTANSYQKILWSMMYSTKDHNSNNKASLDEVFACLSLLEKTGIQHNWSFFYDPTDPPTKRTREGGMIDKFPDYISLDNMVPSPLNFAMQAGDKVEDGVHFKGTYFTKYLETHKEKFHLNITDK